MPFILVDIQAKEWVLWDHLGQLVSYDLANDVTFIVKDKYQSVGSWEIKRY